MFLHFRGGVALGFPVPLALYTVLHVKEELGVEALNLPGLGMETLKLPRLGIETLKLPRLGIETLKLPRLGIETLKLLCR